MSSLTPRAAAPLVVVLLLVLSTSALAQSSRVHPLNAAAAANARPYVAPLTNYSASLVPLSATVDDDIFLQGTFVSLGISGSGSFGTDNPAPAGFARGPQQLGYIFDDDGFGMGNPATTGDFFLPGDPEEGFIVGYRTVAGSGSAQTFANVERNGLVQITPVSVSNLSSGTQLAARFVGVTDDGVLQVTQNVSYEETSKQVAVVITLTNNGTSNIFDVRYLRNVDPDQDVETGGSFTTTNTVLSNFPTDPRAVVQAVGLASGVPFLYVATDPRLRASYGGFNNRDPYASFIYDSPPSTGATVVDDIAVTMTADVGSLAPGESKTFQFFLGFDDAIATDPLLTLSATPLSVTEGGSSTITATLSEATDEAVVVTLAYTGTASLGPDYTSNPTITIPAGSTSASITLQTIADGAGEGDETAIVDVASATNAIEQGEQSVTITITETPVTAVACTSASPLLFSAWDVDPTVGPPDPRGEFAEITNDSGNGTNVDLSGCDFLVFNPFTEIVTYAADAASVLTAGSTYSFANVVVGNGQMIPPNTFPDAPSVFALVSGSASAGQSIGTVLANTQVVAAVVLDRDGTLFGSVRGGGTAAANAQALGEALAVLYGTASEDGTDPSDLAVTAAPNPVVGVGTVSFGVAEFGDVSVALYDALGRQVAVLAEGSYAPGRHAVSLPTAGLPAGLYVVRVSAAGVAQTARLTVVR